LLLIKTLELHRLYTLLDKAVATSNDKWIRITSTVPPGESDGTWPAGPDAMHRRAGIALKRIESTFFIPIYPYQYELSLGASNSTLYCGV
jgi:hypothetical protein